MMQGEKCCWLGWERVGVRRECERMGSSLRWAWETYRRWFDLAQPHICNVVVMLRMIWEDEKEKNSFGKMFKEAHKHGSTDTRCLLLDWIWLIFPNSVDKLGACMISNVSWYTHREEKVMRHYAVGCLICYFSSASVELKLIFSCSHFNLLYVLQLAAHAQIYQRCYFI